MISPLLASATSSLFRRSNVRQILRRTVQPSPSFVASFSSAKGFSSSKRNSSDDRDDGDRDHPPTVLVVGSSGAVGSVTSRYLSEDLGWQVIGADVSNSIVQDVILLAIK